MTTTEQDEHFYGDKCPDGHAGDAAVLLEEIKRMSSELTKANDRASVERADRRAWERSVRAAIRREYADRHAHYARYAISEQSQAVGHWGLVGQVRVLPDKPTTAQLTALRDRASLVARVLLESADFTGPMDAQQREIERLRGVISAHGQVHHAGLISTGERCECGGCELIREMDDVPVAIDGTPSAVGAA